MHVVNYISIQYMSLTIYQYNVCRIYVEAYKTYQQVVAHLPRS